MDAGEGTLDSDDGLEEVKWQCILAYSSNSAFLFLFHRLLFSVLGRQP